MKGFLLTLLTVILLIFCLGLALLFSWSAYATLTNSLGINGSYYSYLHISKAAYVIYNAMIAVSSLSLFVMLIRAWNNGETKRRIFLLSLAIIFTFIICIGEILLNRNFVGKG